MPYPSKESQVADEERARPGSNCNVFIQWSDTTVWLTGGIQPIKNLVQHLQRLSPGKASKENRKGTGNQPTVTWKTAVKKWRDMWALNLSIQKLLLSSAINLKTFQESFQ